MQGFAHHDADVLHRVVLVNIDVALGFDRDVEETVLRKQLQHVVEETNPGVDLSLAAAIQHPFDRDICLFRRTVNRRLPECCSILLHENLLWADLACASNPSMWANRMRCSFTLLNSSRV